MASTEMQLVCKIINTGEMKKVIEWGITPDDFLMLETRGIYLQLLSVYSDPETGGSVLGPRLAATKFTQLNLEDVDPHVTVEHLCQEVRNRRLSKELKECAQQVIETADTRPAEAVTLLQSGVQQILSLDSGRSKDVGFAQGMQGVLDRYQQAQEGGMIGRYPWPWSPLQAETGGIQEDDYVVFYGRPKSMKSWVLCYLIAWAIDMDQKALVYTKEMTPDNIFMRIAACLSSVSYSALRKAQLTPEEERILREWVDMAKGMKDQNRLNILSAKDAGGRDTVAWLRTKIEKYQPTVCFIDGLYLMSPENPKIVKDNERVASISRALRQLILETKVPVIATMQANRKAAGHDRAELDEIAFSDTISQDCTVAMRVINDRNSPTISLVVGGSREFSLAGLRIHGVPATNFDFHSILTDTDTTKAREADAAVSEEGTPQKRAPRKDATRESVLDGNKAYQAQLKRL